MKRIFALLIAAVMVCSLATAGMAEGIKVGLIGPFTGAAASYGSSVRDGAALAVEEINAQGGVQIDLNPQDDEHDAEKSVNAFNNLLDWGCQLIIGTVTTNPCIAVAAEAYEERVFMLTPSASSTDVTANNDNVFQLCFTDPAQGTLSAQFISEHNMATKVAVIYNNADAYSTGIYQTFIAKAAEVGLEVVAETTFTDDTTDFSVQVTTVKDSGAELVFMPIYYTPASMILQAANNMGYAPVFFGVDGMDGILNIEGFDTSLAEGVMLLTPFTATSTDPQVSAFVSAYEAKYGKTPDQFAADGYDCAYAVAKLIENCGITEEMNYDEVCELLIAGIQELEITGVTGGMTWSANGEVTKTPQAMMIQNGAYVGYTD